MHGVRLLLAREPTLICTHGLRRSVVRSQIQPARERMVAREHGGLPCERGENGLRHVLREMRVAAELAQCR
ncbi:MAG: hypothetical protein Q7S40_23080 [Opitutaceae bacterium]|nr:hypothetical protein [Opitutaceae bacterium]